MTFSSAYLLITHGSRDRRPQIALEKLTSLVRQQLETRPNNLTKDAKLSLKKDMSMSLRNPPLVSTACLELASMPLHESIRQFGQKVQQRNVKQIQILPLFLLTGVHVTEDIPREIELAQQALGEGIKLELRPHLGSYSGLTELLSRQFFQLPSQGRILLSHGSRRRDANQQIEAMATQLNAVAAYWSVSPSLTEQVVNLATAGQKTITIVPYFLFAGGITDGISQQVQNLQQAFPTTELYLGEPLGAIAELANLIVEAMKSE